MAGIDPTESSCFENFNMLVNTSCDASTVGLTFDQHLKIASSLLHSRISIDKDVSFTLTDAKISYVPGPCNIQVWIESVFKDMALHHYARFYDFDSYIILAAILQIWLRMSEKRLIYAGSFTVCFIHAMNIAMKYIDDEWEIKGFTNEDLAHLLGQESDDFNRDEAQVFNIICHNATINFDSIILFDKACRNIVQRVQPYVIEDLMEYAPQEWFFEYIVRNMPYYRMPYVQNEDIDVDMVDPTRECCLFES